MSTGNTAYAAATWRRASTGILEPAITACAVSISSPEQLWATTQHGLYSSNDHGISWRCAYQFPSSSGCIQDLFIDEAINTTLFVLTETELWRSSPQEGWSKIKPFSADKNGIRLRCVYYANDTAMLYLGTSHGLYAADDPYVNWHKIALGDNAERVTALLPLLSSAPDLLIVSDRGAYRLIDNVAHPCEGISWYAYSDDDLPDATPPRAVGTSHRQQPDHLIIAYKNRLYVSYDSALSWQRLIATGLESASITSLAIVPDCASPRIFAGTSSGMYIRDHTSASWRRRSTGLLSLQVNDLIHDPHKNMLFAATDHGIFSLSLTETITTDTICLPTREEIDMLFTHEPTIQEAHARAIQYADISKQKVEAWKKALKRSAWMPRLSIGVDYDRHKNIDLDRGSTSTEDVYIIGPDERGWGWDMSVSWDLQKLIWNDDALSIDSRSKYTADFRQDILNDVTHLYFERKRIMIELAGMSKELTPERLEKELFLERLTAQLNALTGGGFSGYN